MVPRNARTLLHTHSEVSNEIHRFCHAVFRTPRLYMKPLYGSASDSRFSARRPPVALACAALPAPAPAPAPAMEDFPFFLRAKMDSRPRFFASGSWGGASTCGHKSVATGGQPGTRASEVSIGRGAA